MAQPIAQQLEQIDSGYRQLTLVLASIDPASAQSKLVGSWSAYNILVHIIARKEAAAHVLRSLRDGSYGHASAEAGSWSAETVVHRHDRSWLELQHDLAAAHTQLISLARAMPATVWDDRRAVAWLRAATIEHYSEHMATLLSLQNP